MRLNFQKGDILAVAVTLLLAAVILAACLPGKAEQGLRAEIYLDGKLVKEVRLDREQEFTVEADYRNTVSVKGGKIAISASDCPGEDCVHSGWIGSGGRSIVCLPNRVEIRIVAVHSDVDFAVG